VIVAGGYSARAHGESERRRPLWNSGSVPVTGVSRDLCKRASDRFPCFCAHPRGPASVAPGGRKRGGPHLLPWSPLTSEGPPIPKAEPQCVESA